MAQPVKSVAEKPPLFARMFPLDKLTVLQAQFFDNRKAATGKKGQSDYALKLFCWHRMNKITLIADADWWRIVQLIEPKVMRDWAKKKLQVGGLTQEQFDQYEGVCASAVEMVASGDFEIVRVGHIASPPGKQYCVGQFVLVTKQVDEPIKAYLFIDGDHMALESFKPTRSRGMYRKAGSALYAMIHDPSGFIGQSVREAA